MFARPVNLERTTLQVNTTARSLREFFLSGQMPASAEQVLSEDILYMLLDHDGSLIEAIGTAKWFWQFPNWMNVMSRMKPGAVMVESSEAVMVLTRLTLSHIREERSRKKHEI